MKREAQGFTLIEVMIAMVVLVIGIMTLFTMQISSMHGNMRANLLTNAATLNAGKVEGLIGFDYDDLKVCNSYDSNNVCDGYTELTDADGDGTKQDTNKDGVDDSNNNFGLDDTDQNNATADWSGTSADGQYQIFINVAVDVPAPNLKTIYVHVRDVNEVLSNTVTFIYIKDDII